MEIIIALLILLSASLIVGEIFSRLGLPSVAGQLIAGLILGPIGFGLVTISNTLSNFSDVALFFIIFMIGVEVTTEVLTKHVRAAAAFTLTSFIVPAAFMALVAVFVFGLTPSQGTLVAIAIGVPSISIISVLLYNYKLLDEEHGHVILASVVITDVIAFGILALILGGAYSITSVVVAVVVLIAILLLVDKSLRSHSRRLKDFFDLIAKKEADEYFAFGGMLILGLVVASVLELAGVTFVLGAFFAGMLISEYVVGKLFYGILSKTLKRINNSFFIPLFFSIAALNVIIPNSQTLVLLFAMVAIAATVGSGLNYAIGKRLLPSISGRKVAGIFGGRGAVGVIIGSIALLQGIINTDMYSIIVLGTLVMAIAMPLLIDSGQVRTKNGRAKKRR